MKKTHAILILGVVFAAFCSAQQPQSELAIFGSIEGIVLAADGSPIADAKVYAEPIGKPVFGKKYYSVTDGNGKFLLSHVYVGKNLVFAVKEEDGYPDTGLAVFGPSVKELTHTTVYAGRTTQDVLVRLGPKGSTITGSIVDKSTARPILNSRIRLYRANDPSRDLTAGPDENGRFKFVIPSIPLKLEVSAPGYVLWQYKTASSTNPGVLFLTAGGKLEMDVKLSRTAHTGK